MIKIFYMEQKYFAITAQQHTKSHQVDLVESSEYNFNGHQRVLSLKNTIYIKNVKCLFLMQSSSTTIYNRAKIKRIKFLHKNIIARLFIIYDIIFYYRMYFIYLLL